VVGVLVAGVVVVGPVTEVDVEPLVVLPCAVDALRCGVVGVEQPSAKSTTPTKRVSAQMPDRFLNLIGASHLDRAAAFPVIETEIQLASWTTSASPTLA
jgi:hypothetical protein